MGHNESSTKRKTHSSECLHKTTTTKQKQTKKQYMLAVSLTAHKKALEQKEANSPERSRQQEIIKLRAKINQIETKRTIQFLNKTRSWFFEKFLMPNPSKS
jgi:2-methylcitrate dehydratase PrpD